MICDPVIGLPIVYWPATFKMSDGLAQDYVRGAFHLSIYGAEC